MKFSNKVLSIGISLAILSLLSLLIFTLNSQTNHIQFKSILIGNILAFINFIFGLLFLYLGINRSNKFFLITFYGGILFRLIILSGTVIVILQSFEINEINFIFSLLFFYFFYITVEILHLNFRRR